ncbi:hypothetical protein NLG97_g10926 [Lecanicillium saksenae]|uniref:Uncharacterized protein n=1 Tax=Lecanicillium saksenae TaxID=468837 RepID=A0ACC1QDM3_9HYPO|nr:hypothetical protein NLG97_g10926 [Lecanicillium saksenae]
MQHHVLSNEPILGISHPTSALCYPIPAKGALSPRTTNLPLTSTLVPTFVDKIFGHADAMAIGKSSTPATGARGRRQFPDGFHHDAQQELMRGATPVTTRPFMSSSSPVRRSTSSARNAHRQQHHIANHSNPNTNYYGILADEADEITDTLDAINLESETRKIITKEKERITTRADILRTFTESIASCARKFNHNYAHAITNDFTRSLLRHWNQFLHAGDTTDYSNEPPQMKLPVRQRPAAGPPTNEQIPRQKSVSFADVAKDVKPPGIYVSPLRVDSPLPPATTQTDASYSASRRDPASCSTS